MRDFSLEELGQFRIISDVFGGFSYADNLTQFVEKALNHLELNGSFYTVLQDVRIESGTNQPYYKNAPFLTEVSDADGKEVSMCAWLKSISCVQVACQVKDGWKPPIETYHIRKVCNEIRVPELTLTHYQSGTPPERRYRRAAAPKDTAKAALPH